MSIDEKFLEWFKNRYPDIPTLWCAFKEWNLLSEESKEYHIKNTRRKYVK